MPRDLSHHLVTALRVGIDVGGTFTDVVAIDAATREIVASVKVPTTHGHPDGVAAGIVEGLTRMLEHPRVEARAIAFIAHSTTQATNALLEGDVAKVGVVCVLARTRFLGVPVPFGAWGVRSQVRFGPMRLAPSATFAPLLASAWASDERSERRALEGLLASGCEAIAATAAFGVDFPDREQRVVELARERGVAATSGHDVASSYGLRARTRTAALNAAILPTMVRTARMTADAAERAGIAVPLMIMRSDGGVMDVREVERRPILTMLSGPAAGVAGALLHENVTDGIFIEVGGTSSDLSVIRRGRPQMRPARVGGHRTLLRTLDGRTLAIAGGSLLRVDRNAHGISALRGVGPRSAHIAGMHYSCFTPVDELRGAHVDFVRPLPGDADDCVALVTAGNERVGLTPTCAANLLGYVPAGAFARGDAEAARRAFALVGERLGVDADALARALLERAAAMLRATIDELARDYELPRDGLELVGGGGGAAALVPFTAEALAVPFRIARDAEVISPVGVALALVRDSVERTIPNPAPADIVRVRREALERVVAAGAARELTEVTVEIDPRRNVVRATASGATAAVTPTAGARDASAEELRAVAARSLHARDAEAVTRVAETDGLVVFALHTLRREPAWLPLAPQREFTDVAVVDRSGVARLVVRGATVASSARGAIAARLARLLDDATAFGDVGRALPDCTLVYGRRIADLSGLADASQVLALADEELSGLDDATPIVLILAERVA
jgi:N-methylhydantoinase A